MKSEEFYDELDTLATGLQNPLDAAQLLHAAHPQIPVLYCKKFVVDWIKERGLDVK